ncbi:MAG TPA: FKBP-type peptidyl-prolyl cis-trans isomerase [Candidatus Sulfotelmatobacter sp.]|jgi:peptidylprolyl isomerase|nr:FKBP-type peptidyl-prolyl cis-trans isomerase [Candidatus Sulfotelmatobacter sp.]
MSKTFIVSTIIGVLVLIIFGYFSLGLNGSAHTVTSQQTSLPQTTDSEKLQITNEKIGTGAAVKKGDTVQINYVGTLANGTKFDASADHGGPFTTQIGVGQVIKGWDEGIIGMKVGGKRKLIIPPSFGYGDQGAGLIPPNSTLDFQVELVGINQ